jgi:hypothetical protein
MSRAYESLNPALCYYQGIANKNHFIYSSKKISTLDDTPRRRRHEVRRLQEALGRHRRDGQGVDGKTSVHGHRLEEAGRDR